jgi:GT2 family glycosyltransferase
MIDRSIISVITVNYNGKHFLPGFFESVRTTFRDNFEIEIIVVDNGSTDDSVSFLKETDLDVKLIQNNVNNYTKAINLGIRNAKGDYVAIVNNDTELHPEWLQSLWETFQTDERIGAVQSKILFSDRSTVNSAGVEEVETFHFRDIGFGEEDAGQYDEVRRIDYFSGGAVMLRRRCLEDVGAFDEDFIMFCEDIDFSIRAREKNWKIFYCPRSIVYHKYHGSSSNELCDYFCTRNRFFIIAKHFPLKLPESIKGSHFYKKSEFSLLYHSLLEAVRKLVQYHGGSAVTDSLYSLRRILADIFGPRGAHNFFSQLELMLGLRKITIGIYDHAFHFAGGGQKYAAFMAESLQEKYDVTYIANKDVTLDQYKEWFNIDLSKCRLKIIKIPFFEQLNRYFIDEGMVLNEQENPFDIISKESLQYDVFINANMLGKVQPLSPISVFICHFPDREKERFFCVDQYDYLISNGRYGTRWIKNKWQLDSTHLIYPPVNMYDPHSDPNKKEKIILSVARFEEGGSKKQIEMAKAFMDLTANHHDIGRTWKLILAGGNSPGNPYFEEIVKLVDEVNCEIELKTNLSYSEIRALYKAASIFWHSCGLYETDPRFVEHFGMTTVEAMQNYCVPVVINGGGQVEIVQNGINGFTFATIAELQSHTLRIMNDEVLRRDIAEKAYRRSHEFNEEAFKKRVTTLFSEIEDELVGIDGL